MYTGHIRLIDYAPIPHINVVVKMDKITYEAANKPIVIFNVRLGKKIVGSIQKNPNNGWYFYKPKGGGKGQEMGSILEVKASLEAQ